MRNSALVIVPGSPRVEKGTVGVRIPSLPIALQDYPVWSVHVETDKFGRGGHGKRKCRGEENTDEKDKGEESTETEEREGQIGRVLVDPCVLAFARVPLPLIERDNRAKGLTDWPMASKRGFIKKIVGQESIFPIDYFA